MFAFVKKKKKYFTYCIYLLFKKSYCIYLQAEYIARISTKMNPVREPLQSDESNLLPSKASASGEVFSA